jgi:hypothetical protein
MDSRKDDYIGYRFRRAIETLEEASILADNKKWNAVINRLYYAAFYAVTALLIKHKIEAKSHDGVRIKFGQEFIAKGIFDKDLGRLFTKLFDLRTKGDYGDLFDHDQDVAEPLISQTTNFVKQIGSKL